MSFSDPLPRGNGHADCGMSDRIATSIRTLVLALTAFVAAPAFATSLQVTPLLLEVPAEKQAEGIWLSNSSADVLKAQVRVYRWTQAAGTEQLELSNAVVASPPMLDLAAGARQLVRIIRTGPPPSGPSEAAYRIVVDELPPAQSEGRGIQFVVRYSVPVFVAPASKTATAPALVWKMTGRVLTVTNSGTGRAQFSAVSWTDADGVRTEIVPGLLGYALPGATMHWDLPPPAGSTRDGVLQLRINGETSAPPIALDPALR